jgi:hypothetical protein
VEKNSAAPDVQFVGGEGLTATLVVPYVEFVLTEVLKNAMQVGSSDIALAPVHVLFLRCRTTFCIKHACCLVLHLL